MREIFTQVLHIEVGKIIEAKYENKSEIKMQKQNFVSTFEGWRQMYFEYRKNRLK